MRNVILILLTGLVAPSVTAADLDYTIEQTVARQGFDQKMCFVHARAGIIPPGTTDNPSSNPRIIMTTQPLQLSGSDVFYALNGMQTDGVNGKWTTPRKHESFERHKMPNGNERTVCDFTPKWHANSGRLLGIGHTVVYENNRVKHVRPRETAYAIYQPARGEWTPWRTLAMPDVPRFFNAGAGSVQRWDLPNGDILLPIYFKIPEKQQYATTVLRCSFDGDSLKYAEHGSELTVNNKRGLYEPSVTKFKDRYFLTMRNDDHGYIATGTDGLKYSKPKQWTFDDGKLLGNYNTQQHWVTHSDGLFLVYTRKGANNDHVFRHRAPLFIAQVDPKNLHVIRATERILVPEKGARLGNFGVTEVNRNETWVTVTEWMQTTGPNPFDFTIPMKHGADNRIWVAKIKWNTPNRMVDE